MSFFYFFSYFHHYSILMWWRWSVSGIGSVKVSLWLFRKQRWPVAEWIQSIGFVQMRLIAAPPFSGSMRSLGDDQKCVLRLCETRLLLPAVTLLLLLILVANNQLLNQQVAAGNCVAVFLSCVRVKGKNPSVNPSSTAKPLSGNPGICVTVFAFSV